MNIESKNSELLIAVRNNDSFTLKNLLKNPNLDPTYDNCFLLEQAIVDNSINILKVLLKDKRMSLSNLCFEAFKFACTNNYFNIVELISKNKTFANSRDNIRNTALLITYHRDLFLNVLKNKHQFFYGDLEYFLEEAVKVNNLDVTKYLIENECIDPTRSDVYIELAYINKSLLIIPYLWKIKGVKDILKKKDLPLFNKILIELNKNKIDNF